MSAPVTNRLDERDVTAVDHKDEPPLKKEPEEPLPSAAEIAQLRQQLKQWEQKFQKLCDVARRDKEALQAKVNYLETLIDTKEGIVDNEKEKESVDELKKKVAELTKELGEERKRRTADKEKLRALALMVVRARRELEEEKKGREENRMRLVELTNQLEEERKGRMEDRERLEQQQHQAAIMNLPHPIEDILTRDETQLPIVDDSLEETLFGDDMNAVEDPFVDDRHSAPMEDNSFNNLDEMDDPPLKKPRIKPDKKMDNNGRSDVDESSSNSNFKGLGEPNDTELECPNCEYRSRSVNAWMQHLYIHHSTNPRQLGLALHCECGDESLSDKHSRKCEISKITIVRKNATPKCVMCDTYPKTACGYAFHLKKRHNTTLEKIGIFLTCSCGHEVRRYNTVGEHSKKCNGHEFTVHKLDKE